MYDDAAWRKHDVLALAIIVLGVSLFHVRGLWPGQTFLPVDLANNNLPWRSGPPQPLQNWLISDPLYQFYPFLVYAVDVVRRGGWPLWNPYIFLGHPTFADPLAQPFYPVFIGLGLILGVARGLAIGLWLHVILAATLTYGFLRTIRCRKHAAVLGAFTYAISGYMVTWFETTFWTSTLSWLPGVLWAFELAIRRRSLRYTALAALMMALAILGGQFAFVVTFSLFLGLYAIGRTIESGRRGDRAYAWPLMVLTAIIGLGTLSSAIQTIPFSELLGLSRRVLAQGLTDPLPPQQLITLVVPDFYGNPASIGPYWGALNYSEGTIYAGLPALLLACVAPFWARRFFVSYIFLVAIATVFFVVGGPGVQMLGFVPVLKYASLHRSAFLLPLLIALLAAMALSEPKVPICVVVIFGSILVSAVGLAMHLNLGQAQDHWQELQRPILQAAVLLVITIVLLILRRQLLNIHRQANWGLVGLVFVDLFLYGSRFNPVGPITNLMPPTPAIEYVREHVRLHRVVAYQLNNEVLLGPNVLSIYGIAEGGGYTSFVSARFHQLVAAGDPKLDIWWMNRNGNIVAFSHPSQRLLDLLQVAYVISPIPLADPGVRAEIVADRCEGDSGEITGRHTISGTFLVRNTAINRLDLRFRIYQPDQTRGTLIIRMWQGTDRKRLMLDIRQDVAELEDGQTLTLYFAPEKGAPGQIYTWEIAAAEATHTGVGLCTLADGRPSISVYGADWSEVYQGEVYIFERLAPLPRAYIVYAAEHIPDDFQAVSRLLDESFDLRNVAVVAEPVDLPVKSNIPSSRAEIIAYQDTLVIVKCSAIQDGLLILGDQFHPGWQAYLNGRPTPIIRVNHILRGILLPPGEHQVVFKFAPTSLQIGSWLSLVGIVILIILVAFDRHFRVVR
jgi:hypothetical protein